MGQFRMTREKRIAKRDLDLLENRLDIREDLDIHKYFLNRLEFNPPKLRFNATSVEEHRSWRVEVIEKVKDLIHYDLGKCPLEIEVGPSTTYKRIELTKYYITTAPGFKCPAILARPIGRNDNVPAVIALNGHNRGKINSIGLAKSKSSSYYGLELAQHGFVTLSLDQWGWGERKGVYRSRSEKENEKISARIALLMGMTANGIRTWEVSRAIDFLQTLPFVGEKFGVIGQSGGGKTAAYCSALDDRITAAVISGHFCSWEYSILGSGHCICNHVPGIMKYVDLPDIVATRAPKPTFIIAGDRDRLFPIEGVKKGYRVLEEAYKLYGEEGNLGLDIINHTGHRFRGTYAYPWLDQMLK